MNDDDNKLWTKSAYVGAYAGSQSIHGGISNILPDDKK